MAVRVLIVRIVRILLLLLLPVIRGRRWSLAFLLFVNRNVRVNLPKSAFADLACFLESLTADKIVTDTTLPAVSGTPVLEMRIHLLHGVVDLLQIHNTIRGF